jgi:nucleoside-diphosphate-sugar epimerase
LIKLTPGDQLRDFIYIDDVVAAYIAIINSLDIIGSQIVKEFEVGSGEVHTIKDFVLTAQRIIGSGSELSFGALPHRENEIMYSMANLNPLLELGWECKTSMEAGIKKIVSSLTGTPVSIRGERRGLHL